MKIIKTLPTISRQVLTRPVNPGRVSERAPLLLVYNARLFQLRFSRYSKRVRKALRASYYQPRGFPATEADVSELQSAVLSSIQASMQDPAAISLMEDITILGYSLFRAQSLSDYIMAGITFLKLRSDGPLLSSSTVHRMKEFFTELLATPLRDNVMVLQDDTTSSLESLEEINAQWPKLKKSPLWRKVRTAIAYVTSVALWKTDNPDPTLVVKVENEQYTSSILHSVDMVHALMDLTLFLTQTGFQCYRSGSIEPIYHSSSAYLKWYERVQAVVLQAKYVCNPLVHGIKIHEFIKEVDLLITQGDAMYKFSPEMDRCSRNAIGSSLMTLRTIRAEEINRKSAQRIRRAPFAVCIAGHSSVAKTTFTSLLHVLYSKTRGLDHTSASKYTRNSRSEFWDGYTSDKHTIIADDIAAENVTNLDGISTSIEEVLNIVNNASHVLNMAGLEEKGHVPCLAELFVATTNSPDLHSSHFFACPLALMRRFAYTIRIYPKPEYIKNGVMIDPTKIPQIEYGELCDYWNIHVDVVVPVEKTTKKANTNDVPAKEFHLAGVREEIASFTSISAFSSWFIKAVLEHNEIQDKVLRGNAALEAIDVCVTHATVNCVRCHTGPIWIGDVPPHLNLHDSEGTMLQADDEPIPEREESSSRVWEFFACVFWYIVSHPFLTCYWMHVINAIVTYLADVSTTWYHTSQLHVERMVYVAVYNYLSSFWGRIVDKIIDIPLDSLEIIKLSIRNFGERVQKTFKTPQFLLCVALALTGALAIYLLWRHVYPSDTSMLQGNIIGTPPQGEYNEPESAWVKPLNPITQFDFSRKSVSYKALEPGQLDNIILRNSVCLKMHYFADTVERVKIMSALGVGGQWYLTTNHCVPDKVFSTEVISGQSTGYSSNFTTSIGVCDTHRYPDKDICLIRLRGLNTKKSIIDLFASERVTSYKGKARYLGRLRDGDSYMMPVQALYFEKNYHSTHLNIDVPLWTGTPDQCTVAGTCGSALCATTAQGFAIFGIHQVGNPAESKLPKTGAIQVTREFLERALADEVLIQPNEPLLDAPSTLNCVLGPVHDKSPVNWVKDGQLQVHGGLMGFRPSPSTHVKASPLLGEMKKLGFELEYGPPSMHHWKPWSRGLMEMVKGNTTLSDDVFMECRASMLKRWSTVSSEFKKELQIYDDFTVVNGVPGMKFIDSINRGTSAGSPWKKSKRYLMTDIPPTKGCDSPIVFNSEIMDRVNDRLESYLSGHCSHPVFTANLKDEPLKFKKIAIHKTRIFMASPIDFTIVMRKVLLSFTRVVQMNPQIFESAPGINAHSLAWEGIYDHLIHFGKTRCVFGDYADYDITMRAHVIIHAFELIADFHRQCGCSDEHVLMIHALGFDIAFAMVDFNGTLITLFGKNPSGQALTVIINGIVNCLYMRYCFYELNPLHSLSLWDLLIHLYTYGDDNGQGVSEEAPWYNHTAIQGVLAKHGITYTMADKGAVSVPYLDISECDFLKRRFRFEPAVGHIVAPLEMGSIMKPLMIGTNEGLTEEEYIVTLIHNSLGELFYHGEDIYVEWLDKFHEMIRTLELQHYFGLRHLLTWEERVRDYKEQYLGELQSDDEFVIVCSDDTLIICNNCDFVCHEFQCTNTFFCMSEPEQSFREIEWIECPCDREDCTFRPPDPVVCEDCGYCRNRDISLRCYKCHPFRSLIR